MMKRTLTLAFVVMAASSFVGCATTHDRAPFGTAQRVQLDPAQPEFKNLYHDGDFFFAGQPTPAGMRMMAEEGVTTVINLRLDKEMSERVNFDEPAMAKELGMKYVSLPMSTGTYSMENVDALEEALQHAKGKVLLHCGSSNRVGVLWANHLHRHHGFSLDKAIARGNAAGMTRDSLVELVRKTAASDSHAGE
jgi:uncharacterized protein (TIGR01244 family)